MNEARDHHLEVSLLVEYTPDVTKPNETLPTDPIAASVDIGPLSCLQVVVDGIPVSQNVPCHASGDLRRFVGFRFKTSPGSDMKSLRISDWSVRFPTKIQWQKVDAKTFELVEFRPEQSFINRNVSDQLLYSPSAQVTPESGVIPDEYPDFQWVILPGYGNPQSTKKRASTRSF